MVDPKEKFEEGESIYSPFLVADTREVTLKYAGNNSKGMIWLSLDTGILRSWNDRLEVHGIIFHLSQVTQCALIH